MPNVDVLKFQVTVVVLEPVLPHDGEGPLDVSSNGGAYHGNIANVLLGIEEREFRVVNERAGRRFYSVQLFTAINSMFLRKSYHSNVKAQGLENGPGS